MMVVTISLASCQTTSEVTISLPEFPTLENPEDAKDCGDHWEIETNYWKKIIKYVADCEKVFEIAETFDKTTIIK